MYTSKKWEGIRRQLNFRRVHGQKMMTPGVLDPTSVGIVMGHGPGLHTNLDVPLLVRKLGVQTGSS